MNTKQDLAILLQGFFTKRLMQQRQASPHTIAAYRDTFRLLLIFAQQRLRKAPCALSLSDLDAPFIAEFLQSLEENRSNKVRTRNLRLTAIRAFSNIPLTKYRPTLLIFSVFWRYLASATLARLLAS